MAEPKSAVDAGLSSSGMAELRSLTHAVKYLRLIPDNMLVSILDTDFADQVLTIRVIRERVFPGKSNDQDAEALMTAAILRTLSGVEGLRRFGIMPPQASSQMIDAFFDLSSAKGNPLQAHLKILVRLIG